MALATRQEAPRRGSSLPGLGLVLGVVVLFGVVWAALSVQAAIMGSRQDTKNGELQSQINKLKAGAPAQAQALPVEVSDQAKAAAYDATLPATSTAPVKEITLTARDDVVLGIAKDVSYQGWAFGDTIPAKPLRVRLGDTVKFTLENKGVMGHGMDFHSAIINPGSAYKTILPGESISFTWKAEYPGVFMFHCATGPVIEHIGNGMYGAIIVDPAEPMAPAKEYALVQSEFYVGEKNGVTTGDINKMLAAKADYVVFNGMVNQYMEHPLTANPGELVRLYVLNAGPTNASSFHVIGAIFSAVYPDGNPANKLTGMQSYLIPAGGGAIFEFTLPQDGAYPFVTHSFADASKGAVGVLQVGQPAATDAGHDPKGHSAPAASVKLAVAGLDNKFNPAKVEAKVGETVQIDFANKGQALHNLRIQNLKGSDGKDVQTALITGGKTASFTFKADKAGTYTYICDVHPVEMKGTITVK